MANQIRLKRGSGSAPSTSDLVVGEVAVRTDTGQLFTKKDDGNIEEIGAQSGIADGSITNAKVNANAAIAGTKISPTFNSTVQLNTSVPSIEFNSTTHENDFRIINYQGNFIVQDTDATANRFEIASNGTVNFLNNVNANSGLDVTGNITATGTLSSGNLTIEDTEPQIFLKDSNNNDDFTIRNNNGVFTIRDATNGADRFTIDSTGNLSATALTFLGNGSSTPIGIQATLRVANNGSSSQYSAFEAASTQGSIRLGNDGTFHVTGNTNIGAGLDVTGNISVTGTVDGVDIAALNTTVGTKLPLAGGTLTGNLTISHDHPRIIFNDTSNNPDYLIDVNAGHFLIYDSTNSANRLLINSDGHIDLLGNVDITNGLDVTGHITATGTITSTGLIMADNKSILLGDSDDFRIRHTGSHSEITDEGTGHLRLGGSQKVDIGNVDFSKLYFRGSDGGGVGLYHNGTLKFGTSSAGINVYGSISVTGTVDGRDVAADGTKLDGIESNATADQTASEILTLIKTVDGSGSGLDADTLDGLQGSSYVKGAGTDNGATTIKVNDADFIVQDSTDPITNFIWRDHSANLLYLGTTNAVITPRSHIVPNSDSSYNIGSSSVRFANGFFDTLYGSGANLTALNASNISSGTVAAARLSTATTQSAGNNTTKIATTAFVSTAINNLINGAPAALDTLNELAAAMNDNASFSTTVTNSLATKMPLAGGQFTGNITFSGSQTVDGRDLSVDGSKLDGIESGATADQSASEILTLIKTVDGDGSGLAADVVDGLHASSFVRSDANDSITGHLTITNDSGLKIYSSTNAVGAKINFSDQSSRSQNGTLTYKHADGAVTTTGGNSNDGWIFEGTENRTVVKVVGDIEATSNIYGAGANITALNASNISSGTISDARLPSSISSDITGNSATATKLATARTIAGVSFDGSANISLNNSNITNGAGYITSSQTAGGFSAGNASNLNSGTLPAARLNAASASEHGISVVGNFGQWQGHSTYTNFNTEPAYWGWNYVQGTTNAPNTTSGQWYRCRLSLGSEYGKGSAAGDYSLEMALPRYSHSAAGVLHIRTIESGSEGSWTTVGDNASLITTGTLPAARLPNHSASLLTSGTIPAARVPTLNQNTTGNAATASDAALLDGLDSSQFLRSDASDVMTGNFTLDGNFTMSSDHTIIHNGTATRDKIRVWTSSAYAIGMDNAMSFGGLNDYAMTFQMNSEGDRGWVFLDSSHTDAQGAMSLTTQGKMALAHSLRLAYGESDTTTPGATYRLDVNGATQILGDTAIGDGSGNSRILIRKADNNVSDHLIFYNGTTRMGEIGVEDTTWLRINQETNKNIYTPRYIRADNGFFVDGTSKGINGSGNFIGGTIAGASDYSTLLRSDTADTASGDITFSGGGGAVTIAANSDIRFTNGNWTGDTCKIQHHGNRLYIVGGSDGIRFRESNVDRWNIDGSGHFVPSTNNTYNIGSSSLRVANLYVNDMHFSNKGKTNDVDGSWGDWTLQEGEEDIFMINNRSGKKFKIAMTPV